MEPSILPIDSGKNITLTAANGVVLTGSAIEIAGGGRLTLNGGLTLDGERTPSVGVSVGDGGTFNMSGGAIRGYTSYGVYYGADSDQNGDGGGTFNMSGGTITNCGYGVNGMGTFNMMTGAAISGRISTTPPAAVSKT